MKNKKIRLSHYDGRIFLLIEEPWTIKARLMENYVSRLRSIILYIKQNGADYFIIK